MDRKKFVKNLKTESSYIDKNRMMDVLKQSINANMQDSNPRGHKNLIIVMEELSELSQAIAKELRGKRDSVNLLEELADVQLGIYYVQEICKIKDEDLNKAMNVKMKRLENVLSSEGEHK